MYGFTLIFCPFLQTCSQRALATWSCFVFFPGGSLSQPEQGGGRACRTGSCLLLVTLHAQSQPLYIFYCTLCLALKVRHLYFPPGNSHVASYSNCEYSVELSLCTSLLSASSCSWDAVRERDKPESVQMSIYCLNSITWLCKFFFSSVVSDCCL